MLVKRHSDKTVKMRKLVAVAAVTSAATPTCESLPAMKRYFSGGGLLCAFTCLAGLMFCGCTSQNEVSHSAYTFKPLFIEDGELPIRDFKWYELRFGEVAGMEARYSTRVGKIISPLGEVAPKLDVVKYMKELHLQNVSFKPPATLADALLHMQNASVPYDGSGKVVLFAVLPKKDGESFPTLPEFSAKDISLAEVLHLVCRLVGCRYAIRDDGVVVVKPLNVLVCDDNCPPEVIWRLQEDRWHGNDEK